MPETVAAIHRVLTRGSSFPSLVETTAGGLYVMKLSGAGPGARALATEFIALELARSLGLSVPGATVLHLAGDLPWQVGTDEFYDAVQRSTGLNLGVAFIADAHDVQAGELAGLPEAFIARLAAVDALLQNVDRSKANPNILRDASGRHWAIDFGACLLIDRLARGAVTPRIELPPNHFLAGPGRPPVRALAATIGDTHVAATVAALPEPWLEELALARETLRVRLQAYLAAVHTAWSRIASD
jgi:HipA-like kinase